MKISFSFMTHYPQPAAPEGRLPAMKPPSGAPELPRWAAEVSRLSLLAVLVTLFTQAIAGEARTVREGDTVILKGAFSIENGLDNQERTVRYQAMKLNQPIDIEFGEGRENNVHHLKLWLQQMPPSTFAKHRGKQLIVSGRIHYFSMGPSTFPNPAKLEVFSVKPISTTMRPNPSLQGTLRDKAAQRP